MSRLRGVPDVIRDRRELGLFRGRRRRLAATGRRGGHHRRVPCWDHRLGEGEKRLVQLSRLRLPLDPQACRRLALVAPHLLDEPLAVFALDEHPSSMPSGKSGESASSTMDVSTKTTDAARDDSDSARRTALTRRENLGFAFAPPGGTIDRSTDGEQAECRKDGERMARSTTRSGASRVRDSAVHPASIARRGLRRPLVLE